MLSSSFKIKKTIIIFFNFLSLLTGRDYIHGEFPKNFDSLLSSGYDDIYEEDDGECTWCSSNPLQTPPLQNQILDHILLKGFTGRNASVCHFRLERERNVLFNDALNTFYLRLYGVRHMVKDHCGSEKGNPLPPHRLLLSINSKGSFICTIPQTG